MLKLMLDGLVRSFRPKPNGSLPRAVDWTARSLRGVTSLPLAASHGEYEERHLPAPESREAGIRARFPGESIPAKRLRPPRHDRQRVGMDDRLVVVKARSRRAEALLHSRKPAWRT